jgi:hypothetical protein
MSNRLPLVAGAGDADGLVPFVQTLAAVLSPLQQLPGFAGKGRYFPALQRSFNREMLLAIALNTGNQRSFQQLLDVEGWSKSQLATLLDALSIAEWLAVQSIWDFFNDLQLQIVGLYQQQYGILPQCSPLRPAVVSAKSLAGQPQSVRLAGGYYPVCVAGGTGFSGIAQTYFQQASTLPPGTELLYTLLGAYGGMAALQNQLHAQQSNTVDGLQAACLQAVSQLQNHWLVAILAFQALQNQLQALGFPAALKAVPVKSLAVAIRRYLADRPQAMQQATAQSPSLRQILSKVDSQTLLGRARQLSSVILWLAVADSADTAAADQAVTAFAAQPAPDNLPTVPPAYQAFVSEQAILAMLDGVVAPLLGSCLQQALPLADDADWLMVNVRLLAEGLGDLAGVLWVVGGLSGWS